MTDINKTVMDVIIDPNVGNQLMDMFYKDPDYFENTYHNKIAPNVLNRFLDVVSSQSFLIPLLSCLLRYNIDENSIDNIAFEKIKAYDDYEHITCKIEQAVGVILSKYDTSKATPSLHLIFK